MTIVGLSAASINSYLVKDFSCILIAVISLLTVMVYTKGGKNSGFLGNFFAILGKPNNRFYFSSNLPKSDVKPDFAFPSTILEIS